MGDGVAWSRLVKRGLRDFGLLLWKLPSVLELLEGPCDSGRDGQVDHDAFLLMYDVPSEPFSAYIKSIITV